MCVLVHVPNHQKTIEVLKGTKTNKKKELLFFVLCFFAFALHQMKQTTPLCCSPPLLGAARLCAVGLGRTKKQVESVQVFNRVCV